MPISLKKAELEDIPTLLLLEKSVDGVKTYSPMLTEDEWIVAMQIGTVYLIEEDGYVVGDVSYEPKGKGGVHISGLVINPEFQRKGISRKAMEQILEELKEYKRIELAVHPQNIKALSLYESLGFVMEEQKENYYGDGEPRLIMTLKK